jgi:sulfite exporter TauE/SafE
MADSATVDATLYFTTGVLMSLGHCLGMCGPLLGAVALAQNPAVGTGRRSLNLLLHHGGRISAYAAVGLAVALLGSAVQAGGGRTLQGTLSLVAGGLMVGLGLGLAGWLPTQRWVETGVVARIVNPLLRRGLRSQHPGGRFALGVANGFLPCGPVYAMALGTMAAASPWVGAGAMAIYGAGTLPVLLVFGFAVGRLDRTARRRLQAFGTVLVVVIGIQLVLRGMAAWGWIGHFRVGEVVLW